MMIKVNEKGFSLVEIIVASVLLALVCAGFFSITLSSKKIITVSGQRHTATEVAQSALDNMRAFLGDNNWTTNANSPFNATGWRPSSTTFYNFTDSQTAYGGFVDSVADLFRGSEFNTRYNGKWRFKVTDPGGGYQYRKVEVEVLWDEID